MEGGEGGVVESDGGGERGVVDSKEGWGKGEGWGQREGEGVVLLACRCPWALVVHG